MYYPVWNVPVLGGAMVIAGISILHVVIAHFAVGAGFFNVISERQARKTGDYELLRFVRVNSKFLVYFAFVAGAISGVGIWFSIGLVSPETTHYLIRLFFWFWAIEWVFFVVELASGYIYYYTWDRLSAGWHEFVGWVYAVSGFMSLVVINGILTFMLTPGDWLETRSIWDAWMNPSFWPSVFLRLTSALSLAGIFVILVAARTRKFEPAVKTKIVRRAAKFLLALVLMPVFAYWYFVNIPKAATDLALGGAVAMTFIFAFGVIASFLVGVYAYFGVLRRAREVNFETGLLLLGIALIATASAEFVREGIRKPYLIPGIVYSNGILISDVPMLNEDGALAHSEWIHPDTTLLTGEFATGEALYRLECLRCHQIDGYNGMIPLIKTWNRPLIVSALDHLDKLKGFMPPFIGTDDEKQALATYLLSLTDQPGFSVTSDTLELEYEESEPEREP